MKKIKVSVIVPVYNVEKYLDRCLSSLVNQTYKDIEIIVVNDESPDNSQKIIDDYVLKYPHIIKTYFKKNGGLSDARNYGIKRSTGNYIAFVDSDDYVELNTYEIMVNKLREYDYDMVVCNLNYVYDTKIVKAYSNIKKDIKDKDTIQKKVFNNIYPVAWNKLYKRELFNNNQFKCKIWFEDVEFIYRILPFIESIGVVDDHLINYVQRSGAITSTFDQKLYNYIDNFNGIIDYYKKNNFYEKYYYELEYSYIRYLYATFIKACTNFNKSDYEKAVDIAIENVLKNWPNYRRNKYFYQSIKGLYLLIFNKKTANIYYWIRNRKG